MNQASLPPDAHTAGPNRLSPQTVGGLFCILAALCYTASNFCMRKLALLGAPPMWATCNRETVTVVILGPWLLWQAFRGQRVLPSLKAIAAIAAVGVAVQVAGNLLSQWSMEIVGLSVNIPVIFGAMLLASAVLGRLLLGESVTVQTFIALGLLIGALVLLGLGAGAAGGDASAQGVSLRIVLMAVAASACAGVTYALLSIAIRGAAITQTPSASLMLIVTGVGTLSLGLLSLERLGPAAMLTTPPAQFAWMGTAGLANLLGLMAITRGLQLTTVVHANMLNASQVAMAAVGGVLLFGESFSGWLLSGTALMIAGIILINRPETPADAEV